MSAFKHSLVLILLAFCCVSQTDGYTILGAPTGALTGGYTGGAVGTIVGGYTSQKISECYRPLFQAYQQEPKLLYFLFFCLVKCETQVVAGINYRLTLYRLRSLIPTCQMVVFQDLGQNYHLSSTGDDKTDCVVLRNKLRG